MRKLYFSPPKKAKNKNNRILSLSWNIIYWFLKSPSFEYFGKGLFIIRDFGSGKTNSLFNIISHQSDIDKIYLYPKDQDEAK